MFLKRLNKYGAGILINHSVVRIRPVNGAEEFFVEYYADNFSWSLYQGDPPVFKFGPMEQFRIMFPYKQKKLDTNN
jgi:hypothetical protein